MTDEEFLAAFDACTLPHGDWTHRAHVRMAWLYLGRLPLAAARTAVSAGIRRYNDTQIGKPMAYHETITQAYLSLIAARRDGAETFDAFCARCEELLDSKLGVLLVHYRRETLFSEAARNAFVAPDLGEFPAVTPQSSGRLEC